MVKPIRYAPNGAGSALVDRKGAKFSMCVSWLANKPPLYHITTLLAQRVVGRRLVWRRFDRTEQVSLIRLALVLF